MTDVRFCKMQKNPRATDFPSRRLECEVQGDIVQAAVAGVLSKDVQ